jgi:WD repeat-containing protein 22
MSTHRYKLRHFVSQFTSSDEISGHDSIVNTAVFHPHFLHIVTSGVERRMVLHSPTPSSPCAQNLPPSPAVVRELDPDGTRDRLVFHQALTGAFTTVGESELAEDLSERRTIRMFDQ